MSGHVERHPCSHGSSLEKYCGINLHLIISKVVETGVPKHPDHWIAFLRLGCIEWLCVSTTVEVGCFHGSTPALEV